MIKDYKLYHGAFFVELLDLSTSPIQVQIYPSKTNASYTLKGSKKVGLYIKHSVKRPSPWRFTFMQKHQDEFLKLKKEFGETFLALVCGKDGIVVLSFGEVKKILDERHEPTEWISIKRGKGKMYEVKGKDGKLSHKVSRDFAPKIVKALWDKLPDSNLKFL